MYGQGESGRVLPHFIESKARKGWTQDDIRKHPTPKQQEGVLITTQTRRCPETAQGVPEKARCRQ